MSDAPNELIHEFVWTVPGTPDEVFDAFAEGRRLSRWFAEHAEVDPRSGGAFRFWGRHTYGAPGREAADQTILDLRPHQKLAFSWTVEGRSSIVGLEFRKGDKARDGTPTTLVVGRHRFAEAPAIERLGEMIDDLWRLHHGALVAHLQGDPHPVRVDFADPEPKIRLTVVIEAPVARVFQALTDADILNRWIASAAEVEPVTGGIYTYGWRYPVGDTLVDGGPSRILEIDQDRKLVTDWADWRGDPAVPAQRITWLFEAEDEDATRLTVIHDGFVRPVDISDYPFGWPDFVNSLRRVVEA